MASELSYSINVAALSRAGSDEQSVSRGDIVTDCNQTHGSSHGGWVPHMGGGFLTWGVGTLLIFYTIGFDHFGGRVDIESPCHQERQVLGALYCSCICTPDKRVR